MFFHRIALLKKSDTQMQNYFFYELTHYPLSLFNKCGMRKSSKSIFYDLFTRITDKINFQCADYVVDGVFLLHRVIWKNGENFSALLGIYVACMKKYYNQGATSTTVVFDGYPKDLPEKSIKTAERLDTEYLDTGHPDTVYLDEVFGDLMTVTLTQEQFLSNYCNKGKLRAMLSFKLESEGFFLQK
ncbi:hypothetical protein AVEN_175316-1 [Araneus ventricosus]|uniref:Uncharacterized protein n=1 Tax=Araneus ventricosus TaxID=182803 RepID=A0A4Y2GDS5_ARAVE|nr:hypothetical protein AVEN_175316-1 [Araneus ventricosus]